MFNLIRPEKKASGYVFSSLIKLVHTSKNHLNAITWCTIYHSKCICTERAGFKCMIRSPLTYHHKSTNIVSSAAINQ